MAIRGLDIDLHLTDGRTIDVTGYAVRLSAKDGRPVDAASERPGTARLTLRIDDGLIAADGTGTYGPDDLDNSELRANARLSNGTHLPWWAGRIIDVGHTDPTDGPDISIVLAAVDLIGRAANAGRVADQSLGIQAVRDPAKDIPDSGPARVAGLCVNDTLIYGARTDRVVSMWTRVTVGDDGSIEGLEPADPASWTLAAANADPQGIAAHEDLIWCLDGTDDKVYGYATAPAVTADAAHDIAYADTVGASTRLDYADGLAWIIDLGADRVESSAGIGFDLAAANDMPRGVHHNRDGNDPTIRVLDNDGTLYGYRETRAETSVWARDAAQDPPDTLIHGTHVTRNGEYVHDAFFGSGYIWTDRYRGTDNRQGTTGLRFVGPTSGGTFSICHYPHWPSSRYGALAVSYDVPSETGAFTIAYNFIGQGVAEDVEDFPSAVAGAQILGYSDEHLWTYDTYNYTLANGTVQQRVVARSWHDPDYDPDVDASPDVTNFAAHASRDIYTDQPAAAIGHNDCRVVEDWLIIDLDAADGELHAWSILDGTRDHTADHDPYPGQSRRIAGASADRIFITYDPDGTDDDIRSWIVGSEVTDTWAHDDTYDIDLAAFSGTARDIARSQDADTDRWWILFSGHIRAWHPDGTRDSGSDITLQTANADAEAVTTDNTYLYVADTDGTVYAYDIAAGAAASQRNFGITAGDAAQGIAWTGTAWLIGDTGAAHGYTAAARLTAPARYAAGDFGLDADAHTGTPTGIAYADDTLLICDDGQSEIRAYTADGTRIPDKDIAGPPAATLKGLTTDGVTLWAVADGDDHAHAYDLSTRTVRDGYDFGLDALNVDASAISIDGGRTIHIADSTDPVIYGYDVSPIESIARPRESAAARYRAILALVEDDAPSPLAGSHTLPTGPITGPIADALNAVETAEYGRAAGGLLVPRGRYRPHPDDNILTGGDTPERRIWLVAHREIKLAATTPSQIAATARLVLVPPRRLSVGWLLGDPQRSLLAQTTYPIADR